ncbi:hypothetical protein Purlil1_13695 [Purpureocillium lilacinum]|uniref:Uncharacterized protein n=1 Tax=Purpureocillium lilacinum TaxID=33203 RepID=A0ABR0BDI9_PURLI|nr:hypothetical protein Purlil1_13695 [Purpureocillium lilacinum]
MMASHSSGVSLWVEVSTLCCPVRTAQYSTVQYTGNQERRLREQGTRLEPILDHLVRYQTSRRHHFATPSSCHTIFLPHHLLTTPSSHDTIFARHHLRTTPSSHDTIFARHHLRTTPSSHDTIFSRHHLRTTPSSHDTIFSRHHLLATTIFAWLPQAIHVARCSFAADAASPPTARFSTYRYYVTAVSGTAVLLHTLFF